jgi:hypothetical protein
MAVRLALVGQAMAPSASQAAPHPEECPATTLAPGAQNEHHPRVGKEPARAPTLEIDHRGPRDRGAATLPPSQAEQFVDSEGLCDFDNATRRYTAH